MLDPDNLPPWLDQELWADFLAHRKETGRPMGETAKKRALIKLYRMKEAGEDVDMVLEQSIERGWRGLFPVAPDLVQKKPQAHQDYKPEPEQESKLTDEEAAENVRYLQDALNGTMKITGSGR